ncbi:MAG: TetR/AcrR family transcriptional regulator [Saccharospirillaceae bacterium]|nr:TetR/AcrR family transcriptional regulator [Pseudomonadales bacterium]NRB81310.1 TetR/AcrR family transcriptional regulator [Saccharospirillaceae bacterium]
MARPRSFDESQVIQDAMLIFWQRGYELTSISELEKATGLSRISIYNTFGDKQGLFLRVLDLYHNNALQAFEGIGKGGLNEIEQFFEWFANSTPAEAPSRFGCLMVNTILGNLKIDESIYKKIEAYRVMLKGIFKSALVNSREHGFMVATDEQITQRVEFLVGVQWGAGAVVRLAHSTTAVIAMNKVVCETIRSWQNI